MIKEKYYIKKDKYGETIYEDCYHIFNKTTKEYMGSIKVPVGTDILSRIEHLHEVLPYTKKMTYYDDYYMEYQGSYPIMVFPEDEED